MLVADLINALQERGLSPELSPAQAQLLDVDLVRACFDSRRVQRGDIFCAIPGHSQQGADFIQPALDAHASIFGSSVSATSLGTDAFNAAYT